MKNVAKSLSWLINLIFLILLGMVIFLFVQNASGNNSTLVRVSYILMAIGLIFNWLMFNMYVAKPKK